MKSGERENCLKNGSLPLKAADLECVTCTRTSAHTDIQTINQTDRQTDIQTTCFAWVLPYDIPTYRMPLLRNILVVKLTPASLRSVMWLLANETMLIPANLEINCICSFNYKRAHIHISMYTYTYACTHTYTSACTST